MNPSNASQPWKDFPDPFSHPDIYYGSEKSIAMIRAHGRALSEVRTPRVMDDKLSRDASAHPWYSNVELQRLQPRKYKQFLGVSADQA